MSNHVGLEQVSSRKLLGAILPTASDLEAFCIDRFQDVAARFASGQNRIDRDNLLLQLTDTETLHEALRNYNPRRFARYQRLLLSPNSATGPTSENPYRGLSAFQVDEADLFFGRDELTERLWQRLKALFEQTGSSRLLAVLGPSGSGKSSVARAGLLAELKTAPIPGPEPVRSFTLNPTDKPLTALAIAILPPSHEPPTAGELSERRDLVAFLSRPNALGELDGLTQWANQPSANTSPFVVLVDQFEEVYTLCSDTKEREAFVGLLLHAAASRGRHVSVVITLRSDFLGETHQHHPELNQLIGAQEVIVTAMSRHQLRQVIAEPATQAGQPIDESTVELLLSQAWGNDGTLPLLEFALTRIWEGMRAGQEPGETLREIGGVGGALAGKAQDIFDKLDPTEQATAKRALVRLVRLGEGTRDTRRRAPISELCGRGETETHVLAVLRKFATEQARLVTLGGEGAEPLAEVTHEALFDHWVALRTWIEQGRKDRGLYDRALDAAKLWQQAGRPSGRLWRPPDLDLLRDYQRRKPEDFGPLATEFLAVAERTQKTEGRLKFGAAAAVVLALLAAAGVYLVKERQRTQEASAARESIRRQLLDTHIERGRQLVFEGGKPGEGLLWLRRAQAGGSTDPALPDLLDSALRTAGTPQSVLIGHADSVMVATYSPDGRHIVTASSDKTARVWEAHSGRLVVALKGHGASVVSATYSPDGRHIATASSDNTSRVWDADSGRLVAVLIGHEARVLSSTYSPDGRSVVTASFDKTARVWDADSGRQVTELIGHGASVENAFFSPDGRRIVTASLDKTARVWAADSGLLVAELRGHGDSIENAKFSPDCRLIVTASWDHTARVWEAESGRLTVELRGHGDSVSSAIFSPDGHRIVTASSDKTARVWESDSGRLVAELIGHGASILSAEYSPDGRHILTASLDNTARVWEADSGRLVAELRGHGASVLSATYSPDGRHVLTASLDKMARVWAADSGRLAFELKGNGTGVLGAMYSPDGRRILAASLDKMARVWEADTGQIVAELKGYGASVLSAAYSPDGRRIVTASPDSIVRVWEVDSGRLIAELIGHEGRVTSASYSPDGRWIVTASSDKTTRVWQADSGRLVHKLWWHRFSPLTAAYSPDGRGIVITASLDKSAYVWDRDLQTYRLELKGHNDSVENASFSPDSRRIVTASSDKTARVWDANSGSLLAELKGHGASVLSAMYSPDGHRIVTASLDGTARVWEADSGRLVAELKGHGASVLSAMYSPDGRRIVTASLDKTVRVWDVSPDMRSPEQLAAFMRCHVPWKFDLNSKNIILLHTPTPEDCSDSAYTH